MFTFVTVVSVESRWTFADVGVEQASAGGSVLTGRRQALVHRCKQEVANRRQRDGVPSLQVDHRGTLSQKTIRMVVNGERHETAQ